MGRKRKKATKGAYKYILVERIGSVSIYKRNRIYYVYYRDNGDSKRPAIGPNLNAARRVAGELNAELQSGKPTLFSFQRIGIGGLIDAWLNHCLRVKHVSLHTLKRYRAAVSHFRDFIREETAIQFADQVNPEVIDRLASHLRTIERTRNGGKNKAGSNPLRGYSDSGIKFILSTCRTLTPLSGVMFWGTLPWT